VHNAGNGDGGASSGDGGAGDGGSSGTGLSPSYVHFDVNHVLVTGQSNSVGREGKPPLTLTQPYDNLMFDVGVMTGAQCDEQGCKQYQKTSSMVPLVEGDTYFNGEKVETVASGLANEVTKLAREKYLVGQPSGRTSHDLFMSIHGRSGRSYWCVRKTGCSWESTSYVKAFVDGMRQVDEAKALAAARGKSYVVRAVAAVHGESDHEGNEFPLDGTDGTPGKVKNYSDALLEWQNDYETSVKAKTAQTLPIPLFVSQMSNWTDRPTSDVANLQLDAHVRAPGKVVLVTPTYSMAYSDDCLHMAAHTERRLGEYFAKAYVSQILAGKRWEPLRPVGATIAGNVVTVKFLVPVPPLVIDTTKVTDPGNKGFTFSDGSASPPKITNVAISGPDTVAITLASAPTGAKKRVAYAQNVVPGSACPGPTAGARGNLRDSDATPSKYGYDLVNWAVHFDIAVP
jgi:hypothetical protein